MKKLLLPCFVLLWLIPCSGQITHSEMQAENSSACSNDSHCYATFSGMVDTRPGILSKNVNIAPVNISGPGFGNSSDYPRSPHGASIKQMLPVEIQAPGVKFLAHFMPWFDPIVAPNDHVDVGYTSFQESTVSAQINNILERGMDGVIVDWYGGPNTCRILNPTLQPGEIDDHTRMGEVCEQKIIRQDETLKLIRNGTVRLRVAGNVVYATMIDQGSFNSARNCATNAVGADSVRCVQAKLEADIEYARGNHFEQSNYYKATLSGESQAKPVLFTFINETENDDSPIRFNKCADLAEGCPLLRPTFAETGELLSSCDFAAQCWDLLWRSLDAKLQTHAVPPLLIFRDGDRSTRKIGFKHVASKGSMAWVIPYDNTEPTISEQLDDRSAPSGYLDEFYLESFNHPDKLTTAVAYKGFNDKLSAFPGPKGRAMGQKCGMTWVNTFKAIANRFSENYPIQVVQVATWNDYDEGTAIEPGIDNCYNLEATLRAGAHLIDVQAIVRPVSSDFPQEEANTASPETIDHYQLFGQGPDGLYYSRKVLPGGVTSVTFDVSSVTDCEAGCNVFVKMVGKNSIVNKTSQIIYVPPVVPDDPQEPPQECLPGEFCG